MFLSLLAYFSKSVISFVIFGVHFLTRMRSGYLTRGIKQMKTNDNSRPRRHALANHQINLPSYRVISTLPVPALLRAAQSAQDGGYGRPEHQAEEDDKDQGQFIFHNLEL